MSTTKVVDSMRDVTTVDGTKVSGAVPAAALSNIDLVGLRQDVVTLALHSAVTDNKAAYNLPTAFIDQFEDDTGILTETTVDRNSSGEYVNSAGTAVTIPMARFDGTDSFTSAANVHNLADSKVGTIAFWMFKKADDATLELIENTGTRINIRINSDNKLRVYLTNGAGGNLGAWYTNSTLMIADGLTHVIIGWDLANDKKWILFDGVAQSLTVNVALVDNNVPMDQILTLGKSYDGYRGWNAELGQFYWSQVYTDFDVQANIDKFYLDGGVDFDTDGSGPSGTQPPIFLNNAYGTFQVNLGSQGNFYIPGNDVSAGTNFLANPPINATGTLISNVQTALAATTSLSGVFLYTDTTGTATIGTDLKIYMSANNGTNFTEAVSYSTAQTFSGSIKMVRLGKTTVTSGTQVKLKAVWANQASATKVTRLNGWAINY